MGGGKNRNRDIKVEKKMFWQMHGQFLLPYSIRKRCGGPVGRLQLGPALSESLHPPRHRSSAGGAQRMDSKGDRSYQSMLKRLDPQVFSALIEVMGGLFRSSVTFFGCFRGDARRRAGSSSQG